jgi:hypothetical protein
MSACGRGRTPTGGVAKPAVEPRAAVCAVRGGARNRLLRLCCLVAAWLILASSGFPKVAHGDSVSADYSLGVYPSSPSVAQGGSLGLHISTDRASYVLSVWREGATRELMHESPELGGVQLACSGGYATGCHWPIAYELEIPSKWPSGAYSVEAPTSGATKKAMFWVRENQPGSTSKVLFLAAFNTYHAYNNFGGKSLYDFNSSDKQRARKVSFDRPFSKYDGLGDFLSERGLIAWAESKGYALEYATDADLELKSKLLNPYQVVVLAGHSEYWTWSMRQRLKAFLDRGGRLINLSGDTMIYQVRYEDAGRTLVGYKDYREDPATARSDETDRAWEHPIRDGASVIVGGYSVFGVFSLLPPLGFADGYGGYWVQQPSHWVFDGAGVAAGSVIGRTGSADTAVVGGEADGTGFNCDEDGATILGPTANAGTPGNFTILGTAPLKGSNSDTDGYGPGFAVMGIFTNSKGGAVFSGNSLTWPNALGDAQVSRITKNVFDRFIAKSFPREPRNPDAGYLFRDRFNCSNLPHDGISANSAAPKWYEGVPEHNYVVATSKPGTVSYSKNCGLAGGTGLEIAAGTSSSFLLRSQLRLNWWTTDILYTRLLISFAGLRMKEGDSFILIRNVYDNRRGLITNVTRLTIRLKNGTMSAGYSDQPSDVGTAWMPMPADRPVTLETLWDKPRGMLSLWVDGQRLDKALDLSARPSINRSDLTLQGLDTDTAGTLCLDDLILDDGVPTS